MISAVLNLDDLGKNMVAAGGEWRFGASFIEVFPSPILEAEIREDGGVVEIWIGELEDPFDLASPFRNDLDCYRNSGDCEGLKVHFRTVVGEPVIEIARTGTGGCPIYLSSNGRSVCVSWKFEEAVRLIPNPVPNIEACQIYLGEGPGRVRDQVIAGVYMLWPGESARFDAAGLRFRAVEPPPIVQSGTLHEAADACGAFFRTVAAALSPVLTKARRPLLELSGGYDSTCVGLVAGQMRGDLRSYGLIQQGAVGAQQRLRRKELVGLLGVDDAELAVLDYPPFAALDEDECTVTPCDTAFRLACAAAIERHPAGNFDLVVTGIGGDELTLEDTHRIGPHDLAGHNMPTAAAASACRADMLMRRGIWPVNPLTSPQVVNFCRALPKDLRESRRINILSMARAGLSDGFLFPRFKEQFAFAWLREAYEYDFDAALARPARHLSQIVDVAGLLAKARRNVTASFDRDLISVLYNCVKLNRVLTRYVP